MFLYVLSKSYIYSVLLSHNSTWPPLNFVGLGGISAKKKNFVSRVSGLKSYGTKKYKDNKRIQDGGGINYGLFIHTARYLSRK